MQSEARSAEELQRRGLKGKPIESPRSCNGGTKGLAMEELLRAFGIAVANLAQSRLVVHPQSRELPQRAHAGVRRGAFDAADSYIRAPPASQRHALRRRPGRLRHHRHCFHMVAQTLPSIATLLPHRGLTVGRQVGSLCSILRSPCLGQHAPRHRLVPRFLGVHAGVRAVARHHPRRVLHPRARGRQLVLSSFSKSYFLQSQCCLLLSAPFVAYGTLWC